MSPGTRGRPPIGPKMELRLTLEQYAWLDEHRGEVPRPEMIRRLIEQAGSATATPDEIAALRNIARRLAEGWSLRIDNLDVVPPYWENKDGEVDLTPAERAVLDAAAEPTPTPEEER